MKHIFLFLSFLSLTACGPRYVDFFPYYDNGIPKPQVVLVPIKTPSDCPAGFSDTFVSQMRYNFMDHGDVYLFSDAEVNAGMQKLSGIDLYGKDVNWASSFCPAEFVVVIDTVEHRPYSYPRGCTLSYVLVKLRLKVIDIRQGCPHTISNELIEICQRICPQEGQSIYDLSVSAGAHQQLAKKVVDRVESIVWSHP